MDTKTLCLAALLPRDSSGYEIKKRLDEPPFCHFQDTGFGSIYPALTRLANEGLIEGTELAQDKRPDKRVFTLTEAGHRHLIADLMQPPAPDRLRSDFLFCLFMSDLLPRAHVLQIVDERIEQLNRKIEEMQACDEQVTRRARRFVFDLGYSFYVNQRDFLVENRHRLEADAEDPAPPNAPNGRDRRAGNGHLVATPDRESGS